MNEIIYEVSVDAACFLTLFRPGEGGGGALEVLPNFKVE